MPSLHPEKRLKIEESRDSEQDDDSIISEKLDKDSETEAGEPPAALRRFSTVDLRGSQTEVEVSLAPVETDEQAVIEYENPRASQATADEPPSSAGSAKWIPGRRSIYVDALNLALDTVLEDEAYLFTDREKQVFESWRALNYECQYLSVEKYTFQVINY